MKTKHNFYGFLALVIYIGIQVAICYATEIGALWKTVLVILLICFFGILAFIYAINKSDS